ncbi:MAG: hypothetical protein A2X34_02305 [Elusimicrobia bacterium GWC2_51_8]|nr:MAG: hypothetical protein A2X33_05220 [Elusimicrobia bacterium GWA2_51_34]OGR59669.1 MAG: hypothetical protein A2X34_02305 [Elusimicrobia bacterium GWC2_51_8]OGR87504.1 MAG: hypothetical protein A2021_08905 [Elusimicrobia bacterium GWF2_52_66]HAF95980.1 hypothetical protein [Elusimicrobiota bacterium]HCE97023.1 hypothetical protein [Elusimicrobiota bacterium]
MPINIQKQNNRSVCGADIGFVFAFIAGCLLASTLITPAWAQNNNTVKIMAYLQEDVDEAGYRKLLKNINKYYADNGIDVNFSPEQINRYPVGGSCGSRAYGNDVIMCVGPGKGSFIGWPRFILGANTDPPYGFTATGIRAEAHELAHFLGFQDLYWLKTLPPLIAPPIATKDIMTDVYTDGVMFGPNAKYIIKMNISRLNKGGRLSILYPSSRKAKKLRVQIRDGQDKTCKIYTRKRNYEKFQSQINATPSLTVHTNSSGVFEMRPINILEEDFDLYHIACDSQKFWLSSLETENCYATNGAHSVCDIVCLNSGEWCIFSPVRDILGDIGNTKIPMIDNFKQSGTKNPFKQGNVSDNTSTPELDLGADVTIGQLKSNNPAVSQRTSAPPMIR